eukprot:3684244-Rhodomonas_salina.1
MQEVNNHRKAAYYEQDPPKAAMHQQAANSAMREAVQLGKEGQANIPGGPGPQQPQPRSITRRASFPANGRNSSGQTQSRTYRDSRSNSNLGLSVHQYKTRPPGNHHDTTIDTMSVRHGNAGQPAANQPRLGSPKPAKR